ncbi:MAG TPA: hypothetical protein VFX51_21265 [Solirubrobacteraceae bacterium]|nr:hypothetical protein [Solirubrobacteraceae bacterium]
MTEPPQTVGELAAAVGVPLADVVAGGVWDTGHLLCDDFSATYEWDMYHERPVESADDLARRRLISYHVHATGEHDPPAPPPVDPEERLAQVRAVVAGGGSLDFEPPMPALELAQALGRPDAVGRSTDVHMSHWVLAEPTGEPLRVGGRTVEATLGGWASGPEVPGVSIPAAAVCRLGPEDVVRSLRISGGT